MVDGKASEILRKARDTIADPDCWCKGWDALTAEDKDCEWFDDEAVKWCAIGGIKKAMDCELETTSKIAIRDQIDSAINMVLCPNPGPYYNQEPRFKKLVSYNDRSDTSHDEIIEVFDKAIDILKDAAL